MPGHEGNEGMSENQNDTPAEEPVPQETVNGLAPVVKQITVKMHADGRVTAAGPLHDRMLCYALLEMGKDAVRNFNPMAAQQNGPGLVLPNGPLPPALQQRMKGG